MLFRSIAGLATSLALAAPSFAQFPILRYSGQFAGQSLSDVLPGGDLDGDGVLDLLIADNDGGYTAVAGGSGLRLYGDDIAIAGADPELRSIGDFNGDGRDDFLVGDSLDTTLGDNRGELSIRSGVDGSILFERFGDGLGTVTIAGDVNADGVLDFANVGSIQGSGTIRVDVFSGATVDILFTFERPLPESLSLSRSPIGDLNGDGHDDLLIGSRQFNSRRLLVLSGADQSELLSISDPGTSALFGSTLSGAGDVNGDGIPDLAASAFNANAGRGTVYLFSGANGALLHRWDGAQVGDVLGASLDGGADVDGDGVPDSWRDRRAPRTPRGFP